MCNSPFIYGVHSKLFKVALEALTAMTLAYTRSLFQRHLTSPSQLRSSPAFWQAWLQVKECSGGLKEIYGLNTLQVRDDPMLQQRQQRNQNENKCLSVTVSLHFCALHSRASTPFLSKNGHPEQQVCMLLCLSHEKKILLIQWSTNVTCFFLV